VADQVAAMFVVALFLSTVIGAWVVLPYVQDGIARDSRLNPVERRHAAAIRLGLDSQQLDAFRTSLRPRERYSMDVPEGPVGPYFSAGKIIRDYAAFYFLPAIKVATGNPVFRYEFR